MLAHRRVAGHADGCAQRCTQVVGAAAPPRQRLHGRNAREIADLSACAEAHGAQQLSSGI